MRYRADITAGALKVAESRIIADLLLCDLDAMGWKKALYDQNVLQTRSPKTTARLTLLLRGRLMLMTPELWTLVRDGSGMGATQACLAAAIKHSALIPLQGKITARIDQLADDIVAASSTAYRKKLEKERETLRKQQMELQAFDELLRHYADQRIRLDLDDGVKVNYGKFGALLAEVKAVTGGAEES